MSVEPGPGRSHQRSGLRGMSVKRTVFASDKTGFHMLHSLFQHSLRYARIRRYDEWFVTSLLADDGKCVGVTGLDLATGRIQPILAKSVMLCTGGGGRIFPFTTSGNIKTETGWPWPFGPGRR